MSGVGSHVSDGGSHVSGRNCGSDEPSGSGGGPHVSGGNGESGGSLGLFMCLQVARLTNSLP